jgi:hypothetical protein
MARHWSRATTALALFFATTALHASDAVAKENDRLFAPWYGISVSSDTMGRSLEIYYLLSRAEKAETGNAEYWVIERYHKDARAGFGGTTLKHDWIDSRKCPSVDLVLKDISVLPKLGFTDPKSKITIIPPSDFPRLRISGPAEGMDAAGGARISRSYYAGAVAAWWAKTDENLRNCWGNQTIRGYAPRLNSPSDLAHWKDW